MATPRRRRERYATDEDYRQRKLREVREAREAKKLAALKLKRLRGWSHIHSCPENEAVIIYDPDIFGSASRHLDRVAIGTVCIIVAPNPAPPTGDICLRLPVI